MDYKSLALGLAFLGTTQLAFAAEGTSRFIIKYKKKPTTAGVFQTVRAPIKAVRPMANGAYSVSIEGLNREDLLKQLRSDPNLLYAVPDRVGHFKPVPDPALAHSSEPLSHESQWNHFKRPAGIVLESEPGLKDGAWAYTMGKGNVPVVVAVLDTGIVLNEHLVDSLLTNPDGSLYGWNFSANNVNLIDETKTYHGTHVSGIIAAYGDVISGVGQDLKVLTLKIPDKSGMFYESSVIDAIYWAVGARVPGIPENKYPAKVLNMSFGVDVDDKKELAFCDEALQEAVNYAREQGAVLAVAAGNDNHWEGLSAPAVCSGTMKIASTGPEGLRSYFSNYGPSITFSAPGGDKSYGTQGGILSTVNPGGGYQNSGFAFYQGTSMAAPHVSAVAGLVFAASKRPLTAAHVEQILYATTHEFGASDDPDRSCLGRKGCGHGIVDAENAVKAATVDYDVYFTAESAVKEKALGPGVVERCEPGAPHVTEERDGRIVAHLGEQCYRLNQASFRECHVVGYDGVGCF
jgi:serine protease